MPEQEERLTDVGAKKAFNVVGKFHRPERCLNSDA